MELVSLNFSAVNSNLTFELDTKDPCCGPPPWIDTIRYTCIGIWSAIVIFGFFGNGLTIAVLLGPKLNNSSTTFYLTALAVVDIMYLIFSVGQQIYNFTFLFPKTIRQLHVLLCVTVSFSLYSLTYISVWLLVAVAIDRMIWVIFPFRAKVICTRNISKIVVGSIILFFMLIDLHFIWTLKHTNKSNNTSMNCFINESAFRAVFPVLDIALVMGIPFIIMVSANILIIDKLRKMEQFRKRMKTKNIRATEVLIEVNNNNNNNIDEIQDIASPTKSIDVKPVQRRFSKDKQTASLTKMLLSVNIFFLISTAPLLIYNSVCFFKNFDDYPPIVISILFLLEKSVYTLWYLNFAVHFLLYCMSGPKFRHEAIRLLERLFCFSKCPHNTRGNIENKNNMKHKINMKETKFLQTIDDATVIKQKI